MGQTRRQVIPTDTLEARMAERARKLREQADELAPGGAKETLLKLARQSERLTPSRASIVVIK